MRISMVLPSVLLLGTVLTVRAAETNSSVRLDYPSFQIISERNIFNPNRSSRPARASASTQTVSPKTTVTQSFALLGTLSYEKGDFAFFDGSDSEYRKVLEPSNHIAGYTISEIASTHVKLALTNGAAIELPVGMQMKRQDEGEWQLTARAESPSPAGTSAGSNGASSEVLKHLMQQRELEGAVEPAGNTAGVTVPDEKMENTQNVEKAEVDPAGEANEVLKKLLEKRAQELNK